MNKAIFLDRDGTINVEKNYLYKIEDFEFLPGVIEALKKLQDAGYLLIIITNQSGIGRGYYTEDEFKKLNNWMLCELRNHGVYITDVYYCPHHPNATVSEYRKECECRKPKLGLFMNAAKDYKIDLSRSFAIGDKFRDCEICLQTSCKGYLIGENEDSAVIDKVLNGNYNNIQYCNDLTECACKIINNS